MKDYSEIEKDWYGDHYSIDVTKEDGLYHIYIDDTFFSACENGNEVLYNLNNELNDKGLEFVYSSNITEIVCYPMNITDSKETLENFLLGVPNNWFRYNTMIDGITKSDWYSLAKDFRNNELYIYNKQEFEQWLNQLEKEDIELKKDLQDESEFSKPWDLCLSTAYYNNFIWFC